MNPVQVAYDAWQASIAAGKDANTQEALRMAWVNARVYNDLPIVRAREIATIVTSNPGVDQAVGVVSSTVAAVTDLSSNTVSFVDTKSGEINVVNTQTGAQTKGTGEVTSGNVTVTFNKANGQIALENQASNSRIETTTVEMGLGNAPKINAGHLALVGLIGSLVLRGIFK